MEVLPRIRSCSTDSSDLQRLFAMRLQRSRALSYIRMLLDVPRFPRHGKSRGRSTAR